MSVELIRPSEVTGGNNHWYYPENILSELDSLWGYHVSQGSPNNNWLKFKFSSSLNQVPIGFKIQALCRLATDNNGNVELISSESNSNPEFGTEANEINKQRFQFALSKDGINPFGQIQTVDIGNNKLNGNATSLNPVIMGGQNDTLGGAWTNTDLPLFYLLIRTISNDGEFISQNKKSIQYVKITVYTDPIVVDLGLVGQYNGNGNVHLQWNNA